MTILTVNAQGELIYRKVVVKHLGVGRRAKPRLDSAPNGAGRTDGHALDVIAAPAAKADFSGYAIPN